MGRLESYNMQGNYLAHWLHGEAYGVILEAAYEDTDQSDTWHITNVKMPCRLVETKYESTGKQRELEKQV